METQREREGGWERERERWTVILIGAPQDANVSEKEDDKKI